MKPILFWGGVALAGGTVLFNQFGPSLPGSIQSNLTFQPVGSFLINNAFWLILAGLVAMLVGLFL